MSFPHHVLNWYFGWTFLLLAFVSGAGIGLFFHREDFLGGYNAFPRRILRLGHIALAALGMVNLLYALSPWPENGRELAVTASYGFVIGGATMPAVCFLTAWREPCRRLFFIPVTALVIAAACTLWGAL